VSGGWEVWGQTTEALKERHGLGTDLHMEMQFNLNSVGM
jgi:hypothetical protein